MPSKEHGVQTHFVCYGVVMHARASKLSALSVAMSMAEPNELGARLQSALNGAL